MLVVGGWNYGAVISLHFNYSAHLTFTLLALHSMGHECT